MFIRIYFICILVLAIKCTNMQQYDQHQNIVNYSLETNSSDHINKLNESFESTIETDNLILIPNDRDSIPYSLNSIEYKKYDKRHQNESQLIDDDDDDELDAQNSTKFEEFKLEDDFLITNAPPILTTKLNFDSHNIYKIAKSIKKPIIQQITKNHLISSAVPKSVEFAETAYILNGEKIANKTTILNFNNFELIKKLYDQTIWNDTELMHFISKQCAFDLSIYLLALRNEEIWAMKASDASGHYRGQFLFGTDSWMGSKTYCKDLNKNEMPIFTSGNNLQMGFSVAIVSIQMRGKLNQDHYVQVGQCLPVSCLTKDIETILTMDPTAHQFRESSNNLIEPNKIIVLNTRIVPGDYQLMSDKKFYIILTWIMILVIITIIATIMELNKKQENTYFIKNDQTNIDRSHKLYGRKIELSNIVTENNNIIDRETDREKLKHLNNGHNNKCVPVKNQLKQGTFQQIMSCFDIVSNSKTILSVQNLPQNSVSCIHGMKVFTILWIIMVHTYLQLFSISDNRFLRVIAERSFSYQLIGNATFSVDTFLFISGLLVTLLYLRGEKLSNTRKSVWKSIRTGTIKTTLLFIYRYLRLTPVYLFILIIYELSLKYVYNQSVFSPGLLDHIICPNYWWRNILYIQNWYPFQELCMSWSWYLANDLQFYIWAIILLQLSFRYFKTVASIVILFLISSWLITGLVSLSYNYTVKISEPFDSFGFLYDRPWTRIGPYIIGMITGYVIYRNETPPKIPLFANLTFWLISLGLLFITVFGLWDGSLSVPVTAVYIGLSHTAWALGLVWITLSCNWGIAKYANSFLSYTGFLPFSRLTYCAYLIHPVTQIFTAYHMEGALHLQHILVITTFLGSAVISFFLAFFISLAMEAPIIRLLRIIFGKK